MPAITYGGLNLNDGSTYVLLPGFDPGAPPLTYDEQKSYAGGVTQTNVSEGHAQMTIPLAIQGANEPAVHAAVEAINALIEAGPQTCVYTPDGGSAQTYYCVWSQRLSYAREQKVVLGGYLEITFSPWRRP